MGKHSKPMATQKNLEVWYVLKFVRNVMCFVDIDVLLGGVWGILPHVHPYELNSTALSKSKIRQKGGNHIDSPPVLA